MIGSRDDVMVAGVFIRLSTIFFLLGFLASCSQENKKSGGSSDVPVTVVTVKSESVTVKFKSIGTIVPREAPLIRARVEGQIDQLLVHEGEVVHKGQILLKMQEEALSVRLKQAEAKLNLSKAQLNESEKTVARADKLIIKGYLSKEEYDQAHGKYETAKANVLLSEADYSQAKYEYDQVNVRSPIDGHIVKIAVSVGEYVSAGATLMNIVNHEQLRAELPFSEQKTPFLMPGQRVILTSPTAPNEKIVTQVTSVTPEINPENRAVRVMVMFQNNYNWKPGASIEGTVLVTSMDTIMVPEACVVMRPQSEVVFVVKDKKAYERAVQRGYQTEGLVAITRGLHSGDQVVLSGAYYLSNGTPVSIQKRGI